MNDITVRTHLALSEARLADASSSVQHQKLNNIYLYICNVRYI